MTAAWFAIILKFTYNPCISKLTQYSSPQQLSKLRCYKPLWPVCAFMLHWHSSVLAESQCAGTIMRPYEIIRRSVDLWLTDCTACAQMNFFRWFQLLLKYWWLVRAPSGKIFVVPHSSTPFPLCCFSPCHPLDATLMHLFCSIEHIGMADFPRLTGALDQTLMLQVAEHHTRSKADERGSEEAYLGQEI